MVMVCVVWLPRLPQAVGKGEDWAMVRVAVSCSSAMVSATMTTGMSKLVAPAEMEMLRLVPPVPKVTSLLASPSLSVRVAVRVNALGAALERLKRMSCGVLLSL